MIRVEIGHYAPLELTLFDGSMNRGVKAEVRSMLGALLDTVNLSHSANGLYIGAWLGNTLGYFHVSYIVFTDLTYAVVDDFYTSPAEVFSVENPITLNISVQQIADAIWDSKIVDHTDNGSFGKMLDEQVSTRADKLDVADIDARLDVIEADIGYIPTVVGDATLAKQNDILSAVSTKANQVTADSILVRVNDIPTNPLLTTDGRLGHLDVAISTRSAPSDIETIKGTGWSTNDTLKEIRDAIGAPTDISPVMASLDDIKGAGFSSATDSLAVMSGNVIDAKDAAQSSAYYSLAAYNSISGKASQTTVDEILIALSAIPTNPVLTNDARINRLDANISSRSTQTSVDEIKGAGFNSNVHSLKNIYDTLAASDHSVEIITLLNDINDQIPSLALQTTLLSTKAAVDTIPLDGVRVNDPRLSLLDVAISSRLSTADFNVIKGAGFTTSNDSLFAISQKLSTVCTVGDISSIIVELYKIEGADFSTYADSLKAANDKAIADRNVLKADLTALLSSGEEF